MELVKTVKSFSESPRYFFFAFKVISEKRCRESERVRKGERARKGERERER
jgi:hypothetical protein